MTDNIISNSVASEVSTKLKGKEDDEAGGAEDDDDSDEDVICNIQEPNWHQFHITIIQLLQSAFFSIKFR